MKKLIMVLTRMETSKALCFVLPCKPLNKVKTEWNIDPKLKWILATPSPGLFRAFRDFDRRSGNPCLLMFSKDLPAEMVPVFAVSDLLVLLLDHGKRREAEQMLGLAP